MLRKLTSSGWALPMLGLSSWLIAANTQAATYYVEAATGNDSNAGSSEASPWKTVQKAAATLAAGDTVYIKNGTYQLNSHPSTKDLSPANSGSAGAGWITYAAFAGHTPVLDGGNALLPHGGLINIRNREYIRITGLTVQNVDDGNEGIGIYVENSRHIRIDHNHVRHTDSSGIQVFTKSSRPGLPSARILIDANDVEDTNRGGPNEMITVSGVDGFEVSNNRVHNRTVGTTGGEGIDVKQGSKNGSIHHNEVWDLNTNRPGIYVDAWDQLTENIDLYGNHVHDIDTHGLYIGSERGGLLRSLRIYNNLIHDNYRAGIYFPDDTGFSGPEPLENILIANNTIARNGVAVNWFGAIHVANAAISGLTIRNNIAWQNGRYQIYTLPSGVTNATVRDNLLFGTLGTADTSRVNSGADAKADPLFVDGAANDYRLQSGSPAIDSGANDALPTDRFDQDGDADLAESIPFDYPGDARRVAGIVDRGAYEWAPPSAAPCVEVGGNVTIQSAGYVGTATCHAANTLLAGGAVEVGSAIAAADLTYSAGVKIRLVPEFRVAAGSSFHAFIAAPRPVERSAAPVSSTRRIGRPTPAQTPSPRRLTFDQLPTGLQRLTEGVVSAEQTFHSDAQGRFIVFADTAALDPRDGNGVEDVYLYVAATDRLQLLSLGREGLAGDGPSLEPRIDGAGSRVVFSSTAEDLTEALPNGWSDIFGYDTAESRLEQLTGVEPDSAPGDARRPDISTAPPLLVYDQATGGERGREIRLLDLSWPGMEPRTIAPAGTDGGADRHHPAIRADGRLLGYLETGGLAACRIRTVDLGTGAERVNACPEKTAVEEVDSATLLRGW